MTWRSKLTPAVAEVRLCVRESLERFGVEAGDQILVAVSGGADSLALASAVVFEAPKLELKLAAVIIDHGLQRETAKVALRTKETLNRIGFEQVEIVRVEVGSDGGMEAAARSARYEAIDELAAAIDAKYVLLGHTQNDQAETVLLGLARGSGARSLSGMAELTGRYLRPLLTVSRAQTIQVCEDSELPVWHDPQNTEERFARVRVRENVLPVLEAELGPGIIPALARTADQLREDAEVLEELAEAAYRVHLKSGATAITIPVVALESMPAAVRYRVLRMAGATFGGHFHRSHVLEIDQLITNWHGQKTLTLPSVRVERTGENIVLKSTKTLRPGAC